jgi:hypothetical protein
MDTHHMIHWIQVQRRKKRMLNIEKKWNKGINKEKNSYLGSSVKLRYLNAQLV